MCPAAERGRLATMSNDLCQLAVHFKTDKWGTHRYAQHYQPALPATSSALEERLVQPPRDVVAVHFYHNLVIIEKGTNAEGTNKKRVLKLPS